jgi:hypothetical protein
VDGSSHRHRERFLAVPSGLIERHDILSRRLGAHRVDLRSEVFLTDMRQPFAQ